MSTLNNSKKFHHFNAPYNIPTRGWFSTSVENVNSPGPKLTATSFDGSLIDR